MTSIRTFVVALVFTLGCDKPGTPSPAPASSSASASVAVNATGSTTASGAPSAAPTANGTAAGNGLVVSGAYDAKLATVRTPEGAPKFDDVAQGALGAGEITMELPPGDGEVTGKTSGPLGVQVFRGQLDSGWIGGALRGEGEGAMWGYLDATVSGAGDARVVTGTLRASSGDGRIVRESSFSLKKK